MLDEGWPGLFREHLLNELPVEKIIPFFREDFGRPSKELYTLLGVLLFQQTMDLNDIDTIEQLSFNIQWHYAITRGSALVSSIWFLALASSANFFTVSNSGSSFGVPS